MWWLVALAVVVVLLVAVAVYDLVQRRHAILRNFPVIGHLRFILESIGPEVRQYIVTDNDQERPFSRDQRRWVYTSSKAGNTYFGFGTDNNLDIAENYLVIKHAAFPLPAPPGEPVHPDPDVPLPCAKVLGRARGRRHAFRPDSVANISAMSFGSLSARAVEALNRGAAMAHALQTTGEGGISEHHRHGGELIWQIGTGYFGCRDERGDFDLARLVDAAAGAPVRAIEIKLSQGAKPGLGGMLPGAKVTPEIAAIRGVPVGKDCLSPAAHRAFSDVDGLLELLERIADATGLPVGIKSAVGEGAFWEDLALRMVRTGTGPDFVVIDGGEGGTGAAPLTFSDHVSLPFRWGFSRVYRTFREQGLTDDLVLVGSGKLGLPENALSAMAMGADMVNVGRTAMFSIGCIQAQRCHTDRCPVGVATQSPRLQRGLDPDLKSVRCANYLASLRFELVRLARACGVCHPALVPAERLELLQDRWQSVPLPDVVGYAQGWGLPPASDRAEITRVMADLARRRPATTSDGPAGRS
ncbi:MAG: FMN-binding glutamate synthase family protein [Acidimicrobiales bacterium]|jgi:glutamate synthase domain-containing protein 2|nr:FMN-binding glutamate synthase family protein [Acidimicrobiales bacterium]